MSHLKSRRTGRRAAVVAAGGLLLAALPLAAPTAGAAPAGKGGDACETRNNNTYDKLLGCVTVDGVREHQAALQAIADANGGTRASGTPGYEASLDYAEQVFEAAGWTVTRDEFPFTFQDLPTLTQLTPTRADYETGNYTGAGSGDVMGAVIPVDLALAPPRASTSGCEAADFAGLDFSGPSDIALIQRGACSFAIKALNAEAAGAEAVIIFNQGNTDGRKDLIVGTLGGTNVVGIPVVGASFAQGEALAQDGSTAAISAPPVQQLTTDNLLAEKTGRNDGNVVMAGAHLDSVQRGPGINDNGSGSAALLELAQDLSGHKPENTVRLALWGAEEYGLIGSEEYVAGLSQAEKDRIALYLNFDMVGSPNFVRFVYDGDESSFDAPVVVPEGSVQIEDLFEQYFTSRDLPYEDSEFSGRSDYQAFIENGIPSGGLFTGAEVLKSPEQAAIWGGTAGQQYDPCYHLACDTFDNVSMEALDTNSDAIAFAVLTYAYSTESVNGVKGKKVPSAKPLPAPAGPEGTVGKLKAGGGGLAHDHDHDHGPTETD